MDSKDGVELLRVDVAAWNRWRMDHPGVRPDLVEADLVGALLRGADLHDAALREARLSGADLQDANLSNADLSGADLSRAKLGGAKLFRTDLSGAALTGADLRACNLRSAVLNRTDLEGTDITGATLAFTVLADLDLRRTRGLADVRQPAPSRVGVDTLFRSGGAIPEQFLLKAGVPALLVAALPQLVNGGAGYLCFISYNQADREFAVLLHQALTRRGARSFFAPEEVLPGEDLLDAVGQGIQNSDRTIVCCSQRALTDSQWVEDELDITIAKARHLRRATGKKVSNIVPLDLDGYLSQWPDEARGTMLRRRHAEDFTAWREGGPALERHFDRVARALLDRRNGEAATPPPASAVKSPSASAPTPPAAPAATPPPGPAATPPSALD